MVRSSKIPKTEINELADNNLKTLRTSVPVTWCPGCPDYSIMEAARRAIIRMTKKGIPRENFVMVAGIGCHGKMFDYLNINGVYGLHGRALPTATGITIGNPNLKVLIFAGDGDTYSEGMTHFIEAPRYNPNITLIVHDNQSFSLTTGQASPTSQIGYKTKAEPLGEMNPPFNPLRLSLVAGAGFVARCNARDFNHTSEIIEAAMNYNGFSFIEVIQDCLIFNLDANNKDDRLYKLPAKKRTFDEAFAIAGEYDYNSKEGKIPLGIIFQDDKKVCLTDKWPQLKKLKQQNISWKNLKR